MALGKKKVEQPKIRGCVGVSLSKEGVAIAHVTRMPSKPATLEAYQFRPCKEATEIPVALKSAVQELGLQSATTIQVLDHTLYEVFLVEEPKVEAAELPLAMRWRIKDYLEYPLEEALIDFIQVPQESRSEKPSMAYVVAAKRAIVEQQSEVILQAGLDLKMVDGTEFAIRNVAHEIFKEGPRAILNLDRARSQLLMMGGQKLYMMRYLEVDLTPIYSIEFGDVDLKERVYIELIHEIQRSLDYCAGNLYQQRPIELLCAPLEYEEAQLIQTLSEGLGIPTRYFDFSAFLQCKTPPGRVQQARCLTAIGGALRQDLILS